MEHGWLRGPALETLKALNGIQVGDHIKFGPDPKEDSEHDKGLYGQELVVVNVSVAAGGDRGHMSFPLEVDTLDGEDGTYATYTNVVAWRRPEKEEGDG